MLGFGLVCFSTAFVTNFGGFMTLRITLGLAEGGMMPGVAYYLSTWYKGDELALRIGLFGQFFCFQSLIPLAQCLNYSFCGKYKWCVWGTSGHSLSIYTSNSTPVGITSAL